MKHQIDKYRKSNIEKNFSFENEVGDLDTEYRDDLEMTQTKKTKLQEVLLMRHGDVSEDRDIGCFTDHGKYRMEKAIPPYRAILQGKRVEIISSPSPKTRESSEMLIDGLHLSSRRKEYNEWTRTLVYVDIISTSDVLYSDHGLSIRDCEIFGSTNLYPFSSPYQLEQNIATLINSLQKETEVAVLMTHKTIANSTNFRMALYSHLFGIGQYSAQGDAMRKKFDYELPIPPGCATYFNLKTKTLKRIP